MSEQLPKTAGNKVSELKTKMSMIVGTCTQFPPCGYDPYSSIKRCEKLMLQLKMNQDPLKEPKQESTYQDGVVDGLGNALAIIFDEIKSQEIKPEESEVPAEDQLELEIPPWEQWPNDQEQYA